MPIKDPLFRHPVWGPFVRGGRSIRVPSDGTRIQDRRAFRTLRAARSHGQYFDQGAVVAPAPHARDDEAADRLWELSARMIVDAEARRRLAAALARSHALA